MAGFRSYYDFSSAQKISRGCEVVLSPEESRHLCGSLRAKNGDNVDIFDLDGNFAKCVVEDSNQKRAVVKVVEIIDAPESGFEIYIAQCLPKGKVFDDIVRQSVEIGAAGIFPLESDRSQVKIDASERTKKTLKWRLHVIEAVKQSANFFRFEIAEPKTLKNFLETNAQNFDVKIVASLQSGTRPIIDILRNAKNAKRVCLLIGPEGDLSDAEYDAASKAGFLPATLGKNVMKCDTAAIFGLSAISAYLSA